MATCDHPWSNTAHRCHVNSDIANENDYMYELRRINKHTGKEEFIGFTAGILYKMNVTDSEWHSAESAEIPYRVAGGVTKINLRND